MEFEKLQMIIGEVMSVDPKEIRGDMSFVDDLGADSLELCQIVMGIEEEFDMVLEESVIENVETVEQAYRAIRDRHND